MKERKINTKINSKFNLSRESICVRKASWSGLKREFSELKVGWSNWTSRGVLVFIMLQKSAKPAWPETMLGQEMSANTRQWWLFTSLRNNCLWPVKDTSNRRKCTSAKTMKHFSVFLPLAVCFNSIVWSGASQRNKLIREPIRWSTKDLKSTNV